MKKIAVVLLCGSLLGGCSAYDAVNVATSALSFAQSSLQKGKNGIRNYCAAIGTANTEALALYAASATRQCRAIVRTQALVDANRAICNNVDMLTATQVATYGVRLVREWKNARNAVVAGC